VSTSPVKVKAKLVPLKKQRQPGPSEMFVMMYRYSNDDTWFCVARLSPSILAERQRELLEAGHDVSPLYMVQLPGAKGAQGKLPRAKKCGGSGK